MYDFLTVLGLILSLVLFVFGMLFLANVRYLLELQQEERKAQLLKAEQIRQDLLAGEKRLETLTNEEIHVATYAGMFALWTPLGRLKGRVELVVLLTVSVFISLAVVFEAVIETPNTFYALFVGFIVFALVVRNVRTIDSKRMQSLTNWLLEKNFGAQIFIS